MRRLLILLTTATILAASAGPLASSAGAWLYRGTFEEYPNVSPIVVGYIQTLWPMSGSTACVDLNGAAPENNGSLRPCVYRSTGPFCLTILGPYGEQYVNWDCAENDPMDVSELSIYHPSVVYGTVVEASPTNTGHRAMFSVINWPGY
jgi:hypothetical protein